MFQKQRIELIIEKLAMRRAERVLVEAGLTGYTILPALGGYGNGKRWLRDTDISMSQDKVVIVAIGEEAVVTKAITSIENLLGSHVGVVSVMDVKVIRNDRF